MSGHSKWSKVKHQKATTDVLKGAAFTRVVRAIAIAVKEGGGITDPESNFHLRLAIEKARVVNMPKDTIERAIEKARGGGVGGLQQMTYEAFGPFGVAFYIETATDNSNRTVAFIKQVLEHVGGSMATPGAVSYLFDRKGVILIDRDVPYDTLLEYALECEASDIMKKDDVSEMYTKPEDVLKIQAKLKQRGVPVISTSVVMQPKVGIPLPEEKRKTIDQLVEQLEESDDIQHVFTNYE